MIKKLSINDKNEMILINEDGSEDEFKEADFEKNQTQYSNDEINLPVTLLNEIEKMKRYSEEITQKFTKNQDIIKKNILIDQPFSVKNNFEYLQNERLKKERDEVEIKNMAKESLRLSKESLRVSKFSLIITCFGVVFAVLCAIFEPSFIKIVCVFILMFCVFYLCVGRYNLKGLSP